MLSSPFSQSTLSSELASASPGSIESLIFPTDDNSDFDTMFDLFRLPDFGPRPFEDDLLGDWQISDILDSEFPYGLFGGPNGF